MASPLPSVEPSDDVTVHEAPHTVPRGGADDAPLEHGDRIGRYVVTGFLGMGGMGMVFTAQDPELDRKVALKLLRSTRDRADNEVARARLLREAQAMARLSHPNVVPVYDVGASAGRLWLAMEHVDGDTFDAWVRWHPRTEREVLAVLRQAGEGLAAAHAAGLVHRDFKPSNVMVCKDGRVMVTDFGLARSTSVPSSGEPVPSSGEHELSGSTSDGTLTGEGTVVGTPAYMAPEQHLGELPGPAADQFAFGVTLFEALLRKRPFVARDLRELTLEKLDGCVAQRSEGLPPALRRIVVRALAPEAADRYPTMAELLADLDRATGGRKRIGLFVAVVAGVAIAAASAWALVGEQGGLPAECAQGPAELAGAWDEANAGRVRETFAASGLSYAPDSAQRFIARMDRWAAAWLAAHGAVCAPEPSVKVGLREARLSCLQDDLAGARSMISILLEGDAMMVGESVMRVGSLPDPQRCANLEVAKESGPRDPEGREILATARAQAEAGRFEPALVIAKEGLARARERGDDFLEASALITVGAIEVELADPRAEETLVTALHAGERLGFEPLVVHSVLHLSRLMVASHRLDEANRWIRHAEAAFERGSLPRELGASLRQAKASVLCAASDHEAALAEYEAALQTMREELGEDHPAVATALGDVAAELESVGSFDRSREMYARALETFRASYGPRHPSVAHALAALGMAAHFVGDDEEALELHLESLELMRETYGDRHPAVARQMSTVAMMRQSRGDHDEADRLSAEALAIVEEVFGRDHPEAAWWVVDRARVLECAGRSDEALAIGLAVLPRIESIYGSHGEPAADTHGLIGSALSTLGRHDDARRHLRLALEMQRAVDPDHPLVADALDSLGAAELAAGAPAEALRLHREALAIFTAVFADDNPDVAQTRALVGIAALAAGDAPQAVRELEQAEAVMAARRRDPSRLAEARFALARALWAATGDRERATALARAALDGWSHASRRDKATHVRAIESWLAQHRA